MAQWYYSVRGTRIGPVEDAELKTLAASGKIKPDDLIWREGMEDWRPARSVKGLFKTPPPLPPIVQPMPQPIPYTDAYVWSIIATPIATSIIFHDTPGAFLLSVFVIAILGMIDSIMLDWRRHKSPNTFWGFACAPVYLWLRCKYLGINKLHFWLFIGSVLLEAIVESSARARSAIVVIGYID